MTTENGAPSLETTGDARVNLFFKLTRDSTKNNKFYDWIDASLNESKIDTLKILFNSRDCRGGKGDRDPFLKGIVYISRKYPKLFYNNIDLIPIYGRYLDLIELYNLYNNEDIVQRAFIVKLIKDQFCLDKENLEKNKPISLLAKWFPSENKKWDKLNDLRQQVCMILFNTKIVNKYHHRELRIEYISPLRKHLKLIENYMCANQWDNIDLSMVPSVAVNRLKKAFLRHIPDKLDAWIQAIKMGRSKINADQIYPHDLVRHYLQGNRLDSIIEEQWKVLVEKQNTGNFTKSLVISDVSGSMEGTPLEVSVALGILIASVTAEPFRNKIITFSGNPELHAIPENCITLQSKLKNISKMHWEMNTNLQAVFELILNNALMYNVLAEDMPNRLYILSDMQFDEATNFQDNTSFEGIRKMYKDSGYSLPQIIFWNLRSDTTSDYPVASDIEGVSLVSGYSPSILKYIMECNDMTPYNIMRQVIDSDRYSMITI